MGAVAWALPPGPGRERVEREARGREKALGLAPGESGRYRPALARVGGRRGREGGERRARAGRRVGGARGAGEREGRE